MVRPGQGERLRLGVRLLVAALRGRIVTLNLVNEMPGGVARTRTYAALQLDDDGARRG
jgi:hypothetical protein